MKAPHPGSADIGKGQPLQLPLDAIDEDPQQPRAADSPGFAAASLRELAQSIRQRGIKTPISVRANPSNPGRYLINHGARRFRAARLAGLRTVPAFVDNDYNEADQVIENLHRNDLTAREIADYIGRELARGLRRKQIAGRISKSAAYITQHAVLLDLPEPVAQVFSAGRVRDVTLVNELVLAYKTYPRFVETWLADPDQEITRGAVRMLREFLQQPVAQADAVEDADSPYNTGGAVTAVARPAPGAFNGALLVQEGLSLCELLFRKRPTDERSAWVRYQNGTVAEVPLASLKLAQWAPTRA